MKSIEFSRRNFSERSSKIQKILQIFRNDFRIGIDSIWLKFVIVAISTGIVDCLRSFIKSAVYIWCSRISHLHRDRIFIQELPLYVTRITFKLGCTMTPIKIRLRPLRLSLPPSPLLLSSCSFFIQQYLPRCVKILISFAQLVHLCILCT